ncbi:MAG: choice-of-anchor D domain-containing protein [Pseudomonadota bacterium]|nr:choice-of-anchor D domain-containing protein [Pseudomonadota bacterium]
MLLLPACIENGFVEPGRGNPEDDKPAIEVFPPALQFDGLVLGDMATQPLTVRNIGLAPLTVVGAQLSGTTAFSLPVEPDLILEPGTETTFDVAFSPVNPEDWGSLYILSDDPEVPSVEVPLSGGALVGELLVLPNPLDFGAVPLGCSQSGSVYVQNVGSVDLTINTIVPLGDDFGATWDFTLPLVLPAGEQLEVPLTYYPDDLTADEGEVWITSDAIVGLTVAKQRGNGTLDSTVDDEWWQGNGPWEQTDIVFYVDQSGSMLDDQERLRSNFSRFVDILEELDLDWQIMVVTDEDGCHNESILDRDTPDASNVFASAVVGPAGRWTEAGLSLVAQALENAEPGGCNEGFLRTNAKTTAVMVSDEPDQSRTDWDVKVARMRSYAPSIGITSIVGDVPDGCETAEPGTGYVEASLATGGAILSICNEDWSSYFETIATLSALGQTDTFVLTSIPDPATLIVKVDGQDATTGWTYDATWNAIRFEHAAIPAPGVQVQAWYDIEADCEG